MGDGIVWCGLTFAMEGIVDECLVGPRSLLSGGTMFPSGMLSEWRLVITGIERACWMTPCNDEIQMPNSEDGSLILAW